jgi:hypothetical protein
MKILFTDITKQPTLIRRSTVLSIPLQLVFLGVALAGMNSQGRLLAFHDKITMNFTATFVMTLSEI